MNVIRGYKTELDLTTIQRTACLKHAGVARFAYNWGLARSQEVSRATGKRPSAMELHKELHALKSTSYPWMYEVSKCAPQEALRDLEQAYKNFFRKAKLKKQGHFTGKCGFPTFKKRSKAIGSFRLTGAIKVFEKSVQLPRLGTVRLHEQKYIPTDAKVLSATVSEQAGRWFVSVQVEEEQEQSVPPVTTAIGVDLGIKTLATLSDGVTFVNPRALKHALIAIEDLHVAGMLKNHCLAQAVSDSNFGEIRRQIEYKAHWHGVHVVTIDRFYPSSKTCSGCGYVKPELALSERTFICEVCGLRIDRDLNAARTIRMVAVSSIDTLNACGVGSSGYLATGSETAYVEAGTNQHLGMA